MAVPNQTGMTTPPIPGFTFNLPFPSTQCGSFIGKSGANIKDIREVIYSIFAICIYNMFYSIDNNDFNTGSYSYFM